jgi:DNA-binding CsgD family transcriptional regulator
MQKAKASVAIVDGPVLPRNHFPSHLRVADVPLNQRETEFLKLVCTELTYKEIAEKMFLSARTIDGYRDTLFEKLSLKSRVGLVIYAIRNGIVVV